MECIYIDDVPVLFNTIGAPGGPEDPRILAALDEAVPDRWREGEWDGEYPLRGHLLIVALSLCDELTPAFQARGLVR